MKKLLIILASVIVLILLAALIAPRLISFDGYKKKIAARVREATGRAFRIDGDVRLTLLPRLTLEVNDVALANAPGARPRDMVKLSKLLFELRVLPLLAGKISIERFVLIEPVIHLEVDGAGRPNWVFRGAPSERRMGGPSGKRKGEPGGGAGFLPSGVRLGDVRLVDGAVTYRNAKTGESRRITGIRMKISLPRFEGPLGATGALTWNRKKVELEFGTGGLKGLLEGRPTPVTVAVRSKPVALDYRGSMTRGGTSRIQGRLELSVPSVRSLARWTGRPIQREGSGLGAFRIEGDLSAAGSRVSFSRAKIGLDEMKAEGEVTVDMGSEPLSIEGRLEVNRLDLNPYLPPEKEKTPAPAGAGKAPGAGRPPAQADWSDDPIDLSALHRVNADLKLAVGGITYREIKIGRGRLAVRIRAGRLTARLTELALYGGRIAGEVRVDGSGRIPALKQRLKLSGVRTGPLVKDAVGFDRFEGEASGEISLAARGRTQREMVSTLEGTGAISFKDGAISGFNLAEMLRNVKTAFRGALEGRPARTEFGEMSGTFRVRRGILRNDDLRIASPLFRVSGKGSVNLPGRTVDYRIVPVAGGTGKEAGKSFRLTVPVVIDGPWHRLSYRPDLKGLAQKALKDPGKTVETVREILEGLRKPPSPSKKETEKGREPGPIDTLKRLFGK